jgi:myo-inositol-1(or 4)-monophosphatase
MSRKEDNTPVTQADHAAQEAVLAALGERFPSHAVLVEEDLARPERHAAVTTAEYCWVIDPIDGTRNFGRGASVYATSVAVLHEGRPVAGAIHDATRDEVFSAGLDEGAFREDERVFLLDRPIDYSTIITISSFRHHPIPRVVRGWMDQYLFRNLGSLCLHLVWVAGGAADAAYSLECKLWDIAAGSLLIQEAGGLVTNHQGRNLWPKDLPAYRGEDIPILAGTPRMHGQLLDSLNAEQAV